MPDKNTPAVHPEFWEWLLPQVKAHRAKLARELVGMQDCHPAHHLSMQESRINAVDNLLARYQSNERTVVLYESMRSLIGK